MKKTYFNVLIVGLEQICIFVQYRTTYIQYCTDIKLSSQFCCKFHFEKLTLIFFCSCYFSTGTYSTIRTPYNIAWIGTCCSTTHCVSFILGKSKHFIFLSRKQGIKRDVCLEQHREVVKTISSNCSPLFLGFKFNLQIFIFIFNVLQIGFWTS